MMEWIDRLGWLCCGAYAMVPGFWLMIHRRAARWRARRRSPYFVLLPLWFGMWVVIFAVTRPWRDVRMYETAWAWLPAGVLFGCGGWLYWKSFKGFSAKQLGGLPELHAADHEQRLVTTGIRGRVRHPIYLAHLCEMLGWSVGTGLAVCYGLTAFAVMSGAVMIRMEDEELEQRFGAEYAEYRKRVPAILPRI
ncbi:MAG TPA: isoprenylcysteine carboxylmethyltransferase family protein [Terriglobales bacterium]